MCQYSNSGKGLGHRRILPNRLHGLEYQVRAQRIPAKLRDDWIGSP